MKILFYVLFITNVYSQNSILNKYVVGFIDENPANIYGIGIDYWSNFTDYDSINVSGLYLDIDPTKLGFFGFAIAYGLFSFGDIYSKSPYKDSLINNATLINSNSNYLSTNNVYGLSVSILPKHINLFGLNLSIFAFSSNINGASISITNYPKSFNGLMFGLFNTSFYGRGIQIGLINRCYNFKGLQIGLFNITANSSFPILLLSF